MFRDQLWGNLYAIQSPIVDRGACFEQCILFVPVYAGTSLYAGDSRARYDSFISDSLRPTTKAERKYLRYQHSAQSSPARLRHRSGTNSQAQRFKPRSTVCTTHRLRPFYCPWRIECSLPSVHSRPLLSRDCGALRDSSQCFLITILW